MPTEGAYSSGHLVLSHFGTCMCSNIGTNLSWACLVSGLLNFEHPLVLLFCFEFSFCTVHRLEIPDQPEGILFLAFTFCITTFSALCIRHGPFDILGGPGIYVWAGKFFSDNIGARLFFSPALRAGLFFS